MTVTIRALFEQHREELHLAWAAGQEGADRPAADGSSEPADLIGYLNLIHPNRIHVVGAAERAYTLRLDAARGKAVLDELVAGRPPAIIVADGLDPLPDLAERAQAAGLPLMTTPMSAARVIETLRVSLAKAVAPTTSMHGVCMDVLGMGVLISGESGLGKSELALELISRGHGLVADDVVEFSRIAPHVVEGRCPPLLQNLLEVRGLGLLDIRTIFGETAVRRKMKLNLIVHLVRTRTMEDEYQRMPLEALTQDVLGLPIRKVVIPVAAGRNLAVLTEAAVRSTILQLRGFDTTGEFVARQRALIESQG
ncbi:HPr(Ser) kinase/phosphatase [Burkholderiaceae bacterium FT117]|uniref:HPr(Ser) kinase/phosphatase n=1 Tax=Zeimonas sediminis TaxID=2944268 RepID=UPI002342D9C7|nr:HPr(Ser) kinase/phosphatase [Zeimonas sediminis]MCM5571794.1 HPr(Ser) kinase/phosphatase [Zeimonas sediminis]